MDETPHTHPLGSRLPSSFSSCGCSPASFPSKDLTIRELQVRAKFNTSTQNKPEMFTIWYYSVINFIPEQLLESVSWGFVQSMQAEGACSAFMLALCEHECFSFSESSTEALNCFQVCLCLWAGSVSVCRLTPNDPVSTGTTCRPERDAVNWYTDTQQLNMSTEPRSHYCEGKQFSCCWCPL